MVTFADTSHTCDSSQLCYIVGLVFSEFKKGSDFYLLSWSAHRSRRPAKSTPPAEISAAGEAVHKTVMLKEVYSILVQTNVKAMLIADLKDLYPALSLKRNNGRQVGTTRCYFYALLFRNINRRLYMDSYKSQPLQRRN